MRPSMMPMPLVNRLEQDSDRYLEVRALEAAGPLLADPHPPFPGGRVHRASYRLLAVFPPRWRRLRMEERGAGNDGGPSSRTLPLSVEGRGTEGKAVRLFENRCGAGGCQGTAPGSAIGPGCHPSMRQPLLAGTDYTEGIACGMTP